MSNFLATFDKTDIYSLFALILLAWITYNIRKVQAGWSWDHFWANLDKFVAIGLFLVTVGIAVHMMHHGSDTSSINWIEGIVSQLLSALLALMGARAWNNRSSQNIAKNATQTPIPPAQDSNASNDVQTAGNTITDDKESIQLPDEKHENS